MIPAKRPLPALAPKTASSGNKRSADQPGTSKSSGLPPKRRPVSIACNNCRKRKVKCDGTRPRCAPCTEKDVLCEFSGPEGAFSRDVAKHELAKYKSVIQVLQEGSPDEAAQALQRLREADNIESTLGLIEEESHPPHASSSSATSRNISRRSPAPESRLLKSPYEDSDFIFDKKYIVNAQDQYVTDDVFVDVSARSLPLSRWTTVSTDDRLMNHLLTLFFTWDNVVERVCYRPILEEDVIAVEPNSVDHRGTFCSKFLINALLAVSCLYTLDPVTFKDPQDSKTRGRRWADEAEAHLESIDRPSIPLLQGLYALFAYEGNIGSGTKSVAYFMRCMDVYKALNDPVTLETHHKGVDEARHERTKQATSWCLWGFYCVEWRSSQAFGFRKLTRKPRLGRVWREPDFPLSKSDCIGYWWFPYPMSLKTQRAMQVEVRDADVKLSEIVEEALDFLYPEPGQHPPQTNPKRALELYDAFSNWKLSCPSRIRFEEAVLPAAILLHIGAEVMFTAILRPFSHMNKEQFGRYNPKELCNAHASSLMSAIWTFRSFAHIRFEYYVCHALGTAAFIVLQEAQNTPIQMDTLIRACQCLHEMSVSLPLSVDILGGIRAAFKRYKLPVPVYVRTYFDKLYHRKDGLMHHTFTALLPSTDAAGGSDIRAEMQLQELLDEFDAVDITID